MNNKNRNTAENKASGRLAAKANFHQREIRRQKICRRGRRLPVSFMVAVSSNRMPKKFTPMISNHPFASIRGHGHHFVIVRIYYRKMGFIESFSRIVAMQFCSFIAQGSRKFLPNLSIDDEKQETK